MDIIKKKAYQIVLLVVLISIAYFNSLQNNFVSDDNYAFVNNPLIFKWDTIFQNPFLFVQPLMYFFISNTFGVVPTAFRIINILTHLGSSILILFIIRRLYNPFAAFAAASIFAVHPLSVESVAWISGGPYAWYTFFFLLSLSLYIYSYRQKQKLFYASSIITYFFALEISAAATTVSLLFLVYEYCFGSFRKNWKKTLPFIALALLFGVVAVSGINARLDSYSNTFNQTFSFYNPLLIIPVAITTYVRLFLFPIGLTLYHSDLNFNYTQFGTMVVITLLFLGSWIYTNFKNKSVFFALSIFFISLIPTLMPFAVHSGVAERYVYCGLIGLSLLSAYVIDLFPKKVREFKYIILIVLLIVFTLRTTNRNKEWRNERSLWVATVKVVPRDPIVRFYLANVYLTDQDSEKSKQQFHETIRLNPYYKEAYYQLGVIYQKENNIEEALRMYNMALLIDPNYQVAKEQLLTISQK